MDNENDESGQDAFFQYRVDETREWLQMNGDEEADEDDAIEFLMDECGQDRSGGCSMADTEYCDFECIFRDE